MLENKLLHCISGSLDVDQVSPEFPMQSSGEYRPISTAKTYDYADCPHQYEELPHLQWVQVNIPTALINTCLHYHLLMMPACHVLYRFIGEF